MAPQFSSEKIVTAVTHHARLIGAPALLKKAKTPPPQHHAAFCF
jgi:hypothetical protein